jgi:glycosyltransferase involved in cell wall biosynthesis
MNSFVVHGKNGLLVRFDGSASDLDSIKSLCATPTAEMSAMREFARSSAIPYSWDTVVERYIDAYDHLMSMSRMIA